MYRIGDPFDVDRDRPPDYDRYAWRPHIGHELLLVRSRPPVPAALDALRRGAVTVDAAVVGEHEDSPVAIVLVYRVGNGRTARVAYVPGQTDDLPPLEPPAETLRVVLVAGGIVQACSTVPLPTSTAELLQKSIHAQEAAVRTVAAHLGSGREHVVRVASRPKP